MKKYIIYILFFFLPSWMLVQNIALISLFLIPPFKNKFNFSLIKVEGTLILFVIYTFLNTLLNGNLIIEQSNLIKLLPFIFIPLIIRDIKKEIIINALLMLLIGTFIIQIISSYNIFYYLFIYEGKKYDLTNYAKLNDILGFERPYLGFFSALNILLSYFFYKRKSNIFFALTASFSFGLIVYISARLALIVSLFFLLYILWKEIHSFKIKIYSLTFCFITSILFLVFFNSSVKKRFALINKDSRNIIWKSSFKQLKDFKTYVFGNSSLNKTRNSLYNFYKSYDGFERQDIKKRFVENNYNTHNQYLNELIRGGIIGLILFIMPFIIIIVKNIRNKEIINLLLLISLMLFLFVENLLERQIGTYLLSIILSISSMKKLNLTKRR